MGEHQFEFQTVALTPSPEQQNCNFPIQSTNVPVPLVFRVFLSVFWTIISDSLKGREAITDSKRERNVVFCSGRHHSVDVFLFRWEQVWSRSAVSCRLTPERSCSWTSTTSTACRTCTMKSWWPCWKRCSETSCARSSLHRRYFGTRMHLMLSAERILKQLGDLQVGPNHVFQMLVSPVTSRTTQTHFWTFKIALW